MTNHLLIVIGVGAAIFFAMKVIDYLLALFAGSPPNHPRHQSPDRQRLPMPCTCGMRRFCGGGAGCVHATPISAEGKRDHV